MRIATSQPVRFAFCNFWAVDWAMVSTNTSGGLNSLSGADIEIINCKGWVGARPNSTSSGARFFRGSNLKRLHLEQNTINDSTGVNVNGMTSDSTSLYMGRNRFNGIDGTTSAGGKAIAQMLQLNEVIARPNILIEKNYCYTRKGQFVEDILNIYNSSGTLASPLTVRYNCLVGSYAYGGTTHSGSGMMIEGHGSHAPKHINAYQNRFISTNNAGVNIFAGGYISVTDNRIVCSGKYYDALDSTTYPDGTPYSYGSAGMSLQNYEGKTATADFVSHTFTGNLINYCRSTSAGVQQRRDISSNSEPITYTELYPGTNTQIANEKQEVTDWFAERTAAGDTIGASEIAS